MAFFSDFDFFQIFDFFLIVFFDIRQRVIEKCADLLIGGLDQKTAPLFFSGTEEQDAALENVFRKRSFSYVFQKLIFVIIVQFCFYRIASVEQAKAISRSRDFGLQFLVGSFTAGGKNEGQCKHRQGQKQFFHETSPFFGFVISDGTVFILKIRFDGFLTGLFTTWLTFADRPLQRDPDRRPGRH